MQTTAQRAERWKHDLPLYAGDVLRIMDKGGSLVPFHVNAAQAAMHRILEEQRERTGRVRAVVLKGRQCGSSTYLVARGHHKCVTATGGALALSMAQDDDTAKKMGRMCDRYQKFTPPDCGRKMTRRSDHEKHWSNGSMYEFRTSSTDKGGRGGTVQYLHFTEMAYFSHAGEQMTGALQQLSAQPGTEAIFESTARGPVGAFYELWLEASDPTSEWTPVFLPWTLMPEYSLPVPEGFTLDPVPPNDHTLSEVDYAERHGCTHGQMMWRREKVRELGSTGEDGWLKFSHEYPACPEDAFEASTVNSFLNPRLVEMARRRNTMLDRLAMRHPLIVGVDPAPSHGDSATAIAYRRGSVCYKLERVRGMDPEQLLQKLIDVLQHERPARMGIDESEGVGHYLVTALRRLDVGAGRIHGVKFGAKPDDRQRYLNKRAEMWSRMAVWLTQDACIPDERGGPGIPTLHSEMLSPERVDNDHKLVQMESKDSMRRRGVPSPDGADALAITFARHDPADTLARVRQAPIDACLDDEAFFRPVTRGLAA